MKTSNNKNEKIYHKNSEISKIFQDYEEEQEELEQQEIKDTFENYIVSDSIKKFSKNANYCLFNWSGCDTINKWELQRKVDVNHVNNLLKSMKDDYEKNGEFIFIEPIHICKKQDNGEYLILDGQHRLETYSKLYKINKYVIQQIPCIVWSVKNDKEVIELFNKINSRLSFDKVKLIQTKLLEIIDYLHKHFKENIWGERRPKLNKIDFCENIKNNDNAHKLSSEEIFHKLIDINTEIRGKPRQQRVPDCYLSSSVHNSAESLNFFLGLDKTMAWIDKI